MSCKSCITLPTVVTLITIVHGASHTPATTQKSLEPDRSTEVQCRVPDRPRFRVHRGWDRSRRKPRGEFQNEKHQKMRNIIKRLKERNYYTLRKKQELFNASSPSKTRLKSNRFDRDLTLPQHKKPSDSGTIVWNGCVVHVSMDLTEYDAKPTPGEEIGGKIMSVSESPTSPLRFGDPQKSPSSSNGNTSEKSSENGNTTMSSSTMANDAVLEKPEAKVTIPQAIVDTFLIHEVNNSDRCIQDCLNDLIEFWEYFAKLQQSYFNLGQCEVAQGYGDIGTRLYNKRIEYEEQFKYPHKREQFLKSLPRFFKSVMFDYEKLLKKSG